MQYFDAMPKLPGTNEIDALIDANTPTFTYETPSYGNTIYYSFDALNQFSNLPSVITNIPDAQRDNIRFALNYVKGITGINFIEVHDPDSVEMYFGYSPGLSNFTVAKDFSNPQPELDNSGNLLYYCDSQYILFNSNDSSTSNLKAGSLGYQSLLQEIGHALGLKTPTAGSIHLPTQYDNTSYTLMSSYQSPPDFGPYWAVYRPFDLEALGWLYGGKGLLGNKYDVNYALNQSTVHETQVTPPSTPVPPPATPVVTPLPSVLPWWEQPLSSDNGGAAAAAVMDDAGAGNLFRLQMGGVSPGCH